MGPQLKETLRCLCAEIGWSYAVFWRLIRRRDQMHLIWEDGYCGRALGMSGFEAMDLLLKERAAALRNSRVGVSAEIGCQADRVGTLVYNVMVPQVHVVGDGIVGQAALTGNHQWILRDSLSDCGSIPKGLAEMNHQFLAGIQTIAIIPVLPHGVVQLGSTQMVMENIGFINHVRSLFAQLGCLPGAVVSNVTQKPLSQNTQLHALLGISNSLNQSRNSGAYISRFSSLSGDKCHHQLLKAPDSISVNQPSCSLSMQLYSKMPANSSEVSSITTASTMMPPSYFCQPTIHPTVEPILHQHSQLESRYVGAQVLLANPDVGSTENAMLHDSSSGSQHHTQILTSHLLSSGLTLLEKQLSISGSREPAKKHEPKIGNSRTSQPESRGCMFSTCSKDTDTFALPLGESESPNNVNDLERCSSFPVDTSGSYSSQCPISSSMEVPQVLDPTDYVNSSEMLLKDSQTRHPTSIQKSQTILTEGQRKKDDSFEALDVTSTKVEAQSSFYGPLLDNLQDGWLSSSDTVQGIRRNKCVVSVENDGCFAPGSKNIKANDNFESLQFLNNKAYLSPVQPASGNDLFDLLGLNNKSRGFPGSLDYMIVHGDDANAHELSTCVSTCITQVDMGPVDDALNEEISCSGLFSKASPDQLLDAVVAQINSGAKQNLYDNVSSLHTSSATCGLVGSMEQMPGKCLDLSNMLVKSEAAGSSSVISACSMDKTGGGSQKDGGYKSQISLWVDNGQNINRDSFSAAHGKRIDEEGKLNRKRHRTGENPRPRPKDRQMIQDRVKELREIVPNGAKCSIDALLEKTIKHMLFLQSVTKHADKLKGVGMPKIVSKEGGLLSKENFEGGATWAFELGTQSMICPIIVEDLNPPHQFLVEMLCEERGLFLEIADLIRGLGLTILKGVMETRNNKVWAHFAVEANKDITRMDIFLSLVHLLEPNVKSSTVPQGVESLNGPHNTFHPSSIPATGLSDCSM